ncbi:MAG: glycosyltransferase family 39 protein [bacterium]|nr:glycosyltransferase family 39 protein [bacterium]
MTRQPVHSILFTFIAVIFILIVSATIFTKQPYVDEGWFYSPAYNLVEHGFMGTSIKETAGYPWTKIDQLTYWQPPVDFLMQAGWYSIFGTGLFSMRYLSAVFALICLISIFSIVRKVTGNYWMALLAMFLASIDLNFIDAASDGRMDMMSTAFAFAAFAVYLNERDKNISRAMLIGHSLVVLSGLTHPDGILALFGMIALNIFMDRKNIKFRHIFLATIPYILGGLGWGLYIMQDPQAFWDQFSVNLLSKIGTGSIFESFKSEITGRYMRAYGWTDGSSALSRLRIFVLLFYFAGAAASFFIPRKFSNRGLNPLLLLFAAYFLVMTLLIGYKWSRYVIYILPLYVSLTAISGLYLFNLNKYNKYIIYTIMVIITLMQLGSDFRRVREDSYHNIYMPVIMEVNQQIESGRFEDTQPLVSAGAELGFGLGFDGQVIEDPMLGYYSGKLPDIIVLEPHYRGWFEHLETELPEVYEYTQELMANRFVSVYRNEKFEILVRKE